MTLNRIKIRFDDNVFGLLDVGDLGEAAPGHGEHEFVVQQSEDVLDSFGTL